MTTIDIVTVNCGKLFLCENVDETTTNLINVDHLEDLDIFILGCQELTTIENGSFHGIVTHYIKVLQKSLLKQLGQDWKIGATNHLGTIINLIFIKSKHKIENVQLLNIPCGLFKSSLKGSSVIMLQFWNSNRSNDDVLDQDHTWEQFIFVCNHLTAKDGDKYLSYRQNNLTEAISKLKKIVYNWDDSHVFIYGDLNFRVNYNIKNISNNALKHDELTYILANEAILKDFKEFEINFKPTYKYVLYQENSYNKKRIPSWCDRILYKTYHDNCETDDTQNIQEPHLIKYSSLSREMLLWTDHQPVELIIDVPAKYTKENPIIKQDLYQSEVIDVLIGYSCWLFRNKVYILGITMMLLIFWVWIIKYS